MSHIYSYNMTDNTPSMHTETTGIPNLLLRWQPIVIKDGGLQACLSRVQNSRRP